MTINGDCKMRLVLLFFILLVSQILIPSYNKGNDFFFMTTWNLFSFKKHKFVYDLYCDQTKGSFYFFRDRAAVLDKSGLKYKALLNKRNNAWKEKLKTSLNRFTPFCLSGVVSLHKLKGSYYGHFFKKENLKIISDENL